MHSVCVPIALLCLRSHQICQPHTVRLSNAVTYLTPPPSSLSGEVLVVHNLFRFCFLLSLFAALISTVLVTAQVRLGASPPSMNMCLTMKQIKTSTHIHACVHACARTRTHTHTHTHTNTHTHTHTTVLSIILFTQLLYPFLLPLPACLFYFRCLHGLLLPHLPDVAGGSGSVSASHRWQEHSLQEALQGQMDLIWVTHCMG